MLSLTDLRQYQKFGVKYFLEHPFGALFLGMGLGKTVIALTALNVLLKRGDKIKTLILAPLRTAKYTWAQEVENFEHLKHLRVSRILGTEKERLAALSADADIWVMNHDNVLWLTKLFKRKRFPFNVIVVDESSNYKSHKAKRFLALKSIRPYLKRLMLLSGTPASNSLLDLWPQIYLIDTGKRLGVTIGKYRSEHFELDIEKDRTGRTYKLKRGNWFEGDDIHEAIIYDKLRDICVSMDTRAYIELPACTRYVHKVELGDTLKVYRKFQRDKILQLQESEITVLSAAAMCNKLKQFAGGEVYSDENRKVVTFHEYKLQALREQIEAANGEPVIIYYWYQHERARILREFKEYTISELKTEKELEQWNAKKVDILLLNPRSAGHGLNLQKGGHIIIWYSLPFYSAEIFNQANKRLDRSGQTKPVLIYILLMRGTVEEDELLVIDGKITREQAFLKAIRAENLNRA